MSYCNSTSACSTSQVSSSFPPPSQAKTNSSSTWVAFLAARNTSNKNSSISSRSRVAESEISKAAEKLTSKTFDTILSKHKLQQSKNTEQVEIKLSTITSMMKSNPSSFSSAKGLNTEDSRFFYDQSKIITPKVQNRKIPLNRTVTKNRDIAINDSISDHSNNPKWVIDQRGVEKSHHTKKQIITSAEALAAAKVEAMMAFASQPE